MSMNKRACEGGISLFLAIVMVALLILEISLIAASKQHDLELRAGRAIDLAGDAVLASYDEDLADQYGLLGYREATLPSGINTFIESELRGYESYDLKLSAKSPLNEPTVIKEQICSYLKLLYPQIMIHNILEKSNLIHSMKNQFASEAEQGNIFEDIEISEGESLGDQLQSLLANRLLEESLNSLNAFLGNQENEGKTSIFRDYFSKKTGVNDGSESEQAELSEEEQRLGDSMLVNIREAGNGSAQSISNIAGILAQGIELLDIPTNGVYERLLSCEYILLMCSNWTDQRNADKLIDGRQTLRGVPIKEMNHYRDLESEYILFGFQDEVRTKAITASMITAGRLALTTIGLLLNENEMKKLEVGAGILSVGIAMVSGGAIVIDATALKYLLLLIRAQAEAIADMETLLNGKTVDLLPYIEGGDQNSDYCDYLRFYLLLAADADDQLIRLAETIDLNLCGPFYTTVETSLKITKEHMPSNSFTLFRQNSYTTEKGDQDEGNE